MTIGQAYRICARHGYHVTRAYAGSGGIRVEIAGVGDTCALGLIRLAEALEAKRDR